MMPVLLIVILAVWPGPHCSSAATEPATPAAPATPTAPPPNVKRCRRLPMNETRENFLEASKFRLVNKGVTNMWVMLRGDKKVYIHCLYSDNTRTREELNSATSAINVTKILSAETQNIGFVELVETRKGFECESLLKCRLIDPSQPYSNSMQFYITISSSNKLACDAMKLPRPDFRQDSGMF